MILLVTVCIGRLCSIGRFSVCDTYCHEFATSLGRVNDVAS